MVLPPTAAAIPFLRGIWPLQAAAAAGRGRSAALTCQEGACGSSTARADSVRSRKLVQEAGQRPPGRGGAKAAGGDVPAQLPGVPPPVQRGRVLLRPHVPC